MKNIFKLISGVLFLSSFQLSFSQTILKTAKNDNLRIDSFAFKIDDVTKVSSFTGNVSLQSKNLSFDGAEKVIWDKANDNMLIYSPKNFKVDEMQKINRSDPDKILEVITYHPKQEFLEL